MHIRVRDIWMPTPARKKEKDDETELGDRAT